MHSYIELINRFWQVDEQHSFSGNETRLYFYLLKVANALGWPVEFEHSDDKATGNLGVSKNTMKPCRDRLVEVGLIDYTEGGTGRGSKVRYQVRYQNLTPKQVERCQGRYQNLTPSLTPKPDKVSGKVSEKVSKFDTYTIYKRIKTKTFFSLAIDPDLVSDFDTYVREKLARPKPPRSAPPPIPPPPVEPDLDEAEAERLEYVRLLQNDRRLIEGLSRLHKLRGEAANEWIEKYVTKEWLANKLKGRTHKDLITHCESWVKIQLEIKQRDEQRQQQYQSRNGAAASEPTGQGEIIRTKYTRQTFRRGNSGVDGVPG